MIRGPVMVDASAWIALFHRSDPHRAEARETFAALSRHRKLVTTTHFALEAHKRLRHDPRAGRAAATEFADLLVGRRLGAVVTPEDHVPFPALVRAWQAADRNLSLEDLSGALTMRALGLDTIWAWDDDFRRLGFRVVP